MINKLTQIKIIFMLSLKVAPFPRSPLDVCDGLMRLFKISIRITKKKYVIPFEKIF
jgi:hypothetical protein